MPLVYALSDPRNPKIPKYIGKTTKPLRWRLNRHFWNAKIRPHYLLSKWIAELHSVGLAPTIYCLELCSDKEQVRIRETHWIRFFRPLGTLLNQSDGDGMLGMSHKLPQSVYDKAAKTKTGRPMSDLQKRRWVESGGLKKFQEARLKTIKRIPIQSEDGTLCYSSMKEACKAHNMNTANLSKAMQRGWRCGGIKWILSERNTI